MISFDKAINAIYINHCIEDYWGDLALIKQKITENNPASLDVFINSPGGDVDVALDLKAFLESLNCSKTIHITGLCASAATVIACTKGASVIMHTGALYMIHEPWAQVTGNAEDLKKSSGVLEQKAQGLAEIYAAKTGLETNKLLKMMKDETWFTSQQAFDSKFVDSLDESVQVFASIANDALNINGLNFGIQRFTQIKNFFNKETLKMSNPNPENKTELPVQILNSVDDIKAKYPDFYALIHDAAVKQGMIQGVEQERARLKALDELATSANAELIAKAKYETFATAEQCAIEILKAQKLQLKTQAAALEDDAGQIKNIVTAQGQGLQGETHQVLAQAVAQFFTREN